MKKFFALVITMLLSVACFGQTTEDDIRLLTDSSSVTTELLKTPQPNKYCFDLTLHTLVETKKIKKVIFYVQCYDGVNHRYGCVYKFETYDNYKWAKNGSVAFYGTFYKTNQEEFITAIDVYQCDVQLTNGKVVRIKPYNLHL